MAVPGLPLDAAVIVGQTGHVQAHNDIADALNYLGSDSQAANLVLASPSGSAGAPDLRAITALDIAAALKDTAVGSVGAPSIAFNGDTDTGLYNIGANQLGAAAGGVLIGTFQLNGATRVMRVGDGTNGAQQFFNGAAGNNRDFIYQSGGSNRWVLRANTTAESGSNVGSDFTILSRDDSGNTLATAMFIKRSTGNVGFGGNTAPNSAVDVTGTLQTDTLRIDQAPVAGAVVPTDTFTISLNGTTYRVPCLI